MGSELKNAAEFGSEVMDEASWSEIVRSVGQAPESIGPSWQGEDRLRAAPHHLFCGAAAQGF